MGSSEKRGAWPRRTLQTVALGVAIAVSLLTPASAASYQSSWRDTGSYDGENYKNRAEGVTRANDMGFYTDASTRTTGNACVRCMGVKIRAYSSDGDLIYQSEWLYNTSTASSISRGWSTNDYGGRFYSKGYSRYFKGDGYSGSWNTNQSPTWSWS